MKPSAREKARARGLKPRPFLDRSFSGAVCRLLGHCFFFFLSHGFYS